MLSSCHNILSKLWTDTMSSNTLSRILKQEQFGIRRWLVLSSLAQQAILSFSEQLSTLTQSENCILWDSGIGVNTCKNSDRSMYLENGTAYTGCLQSSDLRDCSRSRALWSYHTRGTPVGKWLEHDRCLPN
jgi:hypothetical protein